VFPPEVGQAHFIFLLFFLLPPCGTFRYDAKRTLPTGRQGKRSRAKYARLPDRQASSLLPTRPRLWVEPARPYYPI